MRRQYGIIHTMWFSDTRTSLLCCFLKIKGRITGNPRNNANNKKTDKNCLPPCRPKPALGSETLVGWARTNAMFNTPLSKRVLNWSQACWCAAVPIWTAWNNEIGTRIYDLAFSHNRCDPTSWKLLFSVLSIFRCSFKLPSFPPKRVSYLCNCPKNTGFAAQHSATARWHAWKWWLREAASKIQTSTQSSLSEGWTPGTFRQETTIVT